MVTYRKGKFWWEFDKPHHITLQSMRGEYDPALTSDCRCGAECYHREFGNCCDIKPWMALCSVEFWAEEALTPEGLPDGDTLDPEDVNIPFGDRLACDIFGDSCYYFDGEENHNYFGDENCDNEFFRDDCPENCQCHECREREEELLQQKIQAKMVAEELGRQRLEQMRKADQQRSVQELSEYEDHGHDPALDILAFQQSKSHTIVSDGSWESKKNIRLGTKNGSFSHGWRGNCDRYKKRRTRVSGRKLRKIANNIGYPFVYPLVRGQAQRVVCA